MIAHTSPVGHLVVLVAGIAALLAYGWAWMHARRNSPWSLAAWTAAIVALLASVSTPAERWAERSFTGHMAQHLAMIVVAAPLLMMAHPIRTFQRWWSTSPRSTASRPTRTERRLGRWWRTSGAAVAAGAFIGVLYLTHLTSIYDTALTNQLVHDAEHLAYLASATALWAALRTGSRQAATTRIAAVFAVIAAGALLGVVLLSASTPLVATYADRLGDTAALSDQRSAASLMWVGGMATTLPLLLMTVWRWAATEERIAVRSERLEADRSSGDAITAGRSEDGARRRSARGG